MATALQRVKDLYNELVYVETNTVIERLPSYAGFHEETVEGYLRKLKWASHHQCLCVISDENFIGTEKRYFIMEGLSQEQRKAYCKSIGKDIELSSPDIIDRQDKLLFDLKVVFAEGERFADKESEYRRHTDANVDLLIFNYSGLNNQIATNHLTEVQINKVKHELSSLKARLEAETLWATFMEANSGKPDALQYRPSSFWGTSLTNEEPSTSAADYNRDLENYYEGGYKAWVEMKTLPAIPDVFEGKRDKFIKYKGVLLGFDARSKKIETPPTRVNLLDYFRKFFVTRDFKMIKDTSDSKGLMLLEICRKRLYDKALTPEEEKCLGIGLKQEKFKFAIEEPIENYNTNRKAPEPAKYHDWMRDEVYGLTRDVGFTFPVIPLSEPKTCIDVLAHSCFQQVNDIIRGTDAYQLMSKLEDSMFGMMTYCENNRDEMTVIPIKVFDEEKNVYLFGFIIKSHSHLRDMMDRVNFVTFEFFKKSDLPDLAIKYPNYAIFEAGDSRVAIRLNATWKLKMFFHATCKRSIIPVVNTVNRIWFKECAEAEEEVEINLDRAVFYGDSTSRTMKEWVKRVFAIHVQMALLNEPQLEAYCADIRRMQIFTRALWQEGMKVFLHPDASPETKVAESCINNPLVMYLRNCWNHHAEAFNRKWIGSWAKSVKRAGESENRSGEGTSRARFN